MKQCFHTIVLLAALAVTVPGYAYAETIKLQSGMASSGTKISPLLEASKKAMAGDLRGAEVAYSAIIASNPNHIEAYLQRGVMRRELGDATGRALDGQAALTLVDQRLQANPNSAELYRQRSMADRLLKNYPQARTDLRRAMQLDGGNRWQTDLQAITLEEKMGQ